ncbi:MAG: phenylalanyl-tRNA synthetase beta chain, partial [Mariniblastus sp.]
DFAKIKGGKIVVRAANEGEQFEAIDHKTYGLDAGMCVIADASDAVALGGVMGGANSEVSETTTEVLIEAAYFEQLSVRNAARKLKLHSPSSFRFERNVDSANLDWASQRVCELILESAGGTLLAGVLDVGQPPATPADVVLRYGQLERLLGVEIPWDFVAPTLEKLGLTLVSSEGDSFTVTPPSWRKDLTREVDLIEEVGRIYGFEKIPDNVNVPMSASHRPKADRVIDKVRTVMTCAGFDESVTPSLVPQPWSDAFSPWTESPPLISSQPMQGVLEDYSHNIGAVNLLRRSLIPSLLEVRRINEYRSNSDVNLFETAKVYLAKGNDQIPNQPTKLGIVSGRDYFAVKGVIETLLHNINPAATLVVSECSHDVLDNSQSAELRIGDQVLGWIGAVSKAAKKEFGLRSDATVAELDLAVLEGQAVLIPLHTNLSSFPSVTRDFNFIVENAVRWAELESTVRSACGPLLESVEYRETFRNEEKDGPTKKRLLMSVVLRSSESTLTGQQAEEVCQSIVSSCESKHAAALLG